MSIEIWWSRFSSFLRPASVYAADFRKKSVAQWSVHSFFFVEREISL
jgi:hypothetical protein